MSLLDAHDIQGNILKAYGRSAYPKARYLFLQVKEVHLLSENSMIQYIEHD